MLERNSCGKETLLYTFWFRVDVSLGLDCAPILTHIMLLLVYYASPSYILLSILDTLSHLVSMAAWFTSLCVVVLMVLC